MIRTLKFALRYDPHTSLLEQASQAGLAGGHGKRVAQHDQRLQNTIA